MKPLDYSLLAVGFFIVFRVLYTVMTLPSYVMRNELLADRVYRTAGKHLLVAILIGLFIVYRVWG